MAMAMEEELDWELPDELLGHPAQTPFLELVQQAPDRRAMMRRW
jgi:hypothetical protein